MIEDMDVLAEKIAAKVAEKTDARPLLSPAGLAERLGVSERKAREMLAEGVIPSLLVGGGRRVEPSAVDAYIDRQKGDAA
jgi:excisionase family DNA binding protein